MAVWLGFAGGTWRRSVVDHCDRTLVAIDPGSEVLECGRNAVTSLWVTSRRGYMSLLNNQRQRNLRRHPRTRVNWPAILEAGTRVLPVEILNLSPWGAKVRLEDRWPDGKLPCSHPLMGFDISGCAGPQPPTPNLASAQDGPGRDPVRMTWALSSGLRRRASSMSSETDRVARRSHRNLSSIVS